MVSNGSNAETPRGEFTLGSVDPYVLIEALTGHKLDRRNLPVRSSRDVSDDIEELRFEDSPMLGEEPKPDPKPENDVAVGAINPYALVENMIGHKIERRSMEALRIISDTLQTDYEDLFDMKHNSVLFAGLKLNEKEREAEELDEKDMKILKEKDLVTPDLSRLQKLDDLEKVGLENFGDTRIKRAHMRNGKMHLVLHAHKIGKTVCNREVTMTMNEIALPFRRDKQEKGRFTPPNSSWRDAHETIIRNGMRRRFLQYGQNTFFDYSNVMPSQHGLEHAERRERRFDDPVQGATANSWFVAALFSVFWADPAVINRNTTMMQGGFMGGHGHGHGGHGGHGGPMQQQHKLAIKFHDKGGRNNAETKTVHVDYQIPVNNSSDDPVYCRSSNGFAVWPALYEKAFAMWVTDMEGGGGGVRGSSSERQQQQHVDITQLHHGDPIKAMAQINGREPRYYFTDKHDAGELVGLVRSGSVNHRTITPMAAWTHATARGGARTYRGANLVANHAYSVLGWSGDGQRDEEQYVVVRNPWGVTEPRAVTPYEGVLTRVEPAYWYPASLCDAEGVLAIEARAFKEYFACIGVAK
ncbi:hypothetical protein GGR56DRAFT_676854 [Xylariaceae sp. FL0804]|nr:hypothetical protein GGR56DRAFT_676854 [Xylariaceae sp. FL0804]